MRKKKTKTKTESVAQRPTFIELFAGIGGFHQAFKGLAECVFVSEKDRYAIDTYSSNFPQTVKAMHGNGLKIGDILEYHPYDTLPDFDILTAGFPCQPFSNAGQKLGLKDERGQLFKTIAHVLEVKRPKAFLLENVPHLENHTHDGVETFKEIQKRIRALRYSFDHKILSAFEFNLPQRRPRLFMVGFDWNVFGEEVKFEFPAPITPKGFEGKRMTMLDVFRVAWCEREIGYTLRVGGRRSPHGDRRNWDSYMVSATGRGKEEVRVLGSSEGLKMMGFKKDFVFPPSVSEAQRMKQLGNSVAVPVVRAIAQRLIDVLKGK